MTRRISQRLAGLCFASTRRKDVSARARPLSRLVAARGPALVPYKTCSYINSMNVRCTSLRQEYMTSLHRLPRPRWIVSDLDQKVAQGELRFDASQRRVAMKLLRLQEALQGYDNEPLIQQLEEERKKKEELKRQSQMNESLDHTNESPNPSGTSTHSPSDSSDMTDSESEQSRYTLPTVPRGMYIYGSVGSGKSMLMDTFFATTELAKKRRYHFHAFMNMVHTGIHGLKQEALQSSGRSFAIDTRLEQNPVYQVGLQLSREMTLLCLDEFQVTDIADALILRLLFSVLWSRGTVVVVTSNRPPSDLYQGGINYGYFEPFIGLLEKHCAVYNINSSIDYRSLSGAEGQCFLTLSEDNANALEVEQAIDTTVKRLRKDSRKIIRLEFKLGHNRMIVIPCADVDGIVARLSFDLICRSELGASDYRLLSQAFDVLVIERIPVLTLENHDAARRFITLIDEMYENQTGLICSTVAPEPEALFVHSFSDTSITEGEEDLPEGWIDQAQRGGHAVGALASVQELGFAFRRAASRICEMTAIDRWENEGR